MVNKEKVNLEEMRHTAAHLLAAAVKDLYPEAKPTLGPPVEDGFYYDFDNLNLAQDDLLKLEKKMKRLVPNWTEFEHRELSEKEARVLFSGNEYKLELIRDITAKGEAITIYTSGGFTDLCRGGHVRNPSKELKHFALLSIAGAYWRGDEKNKMLTRIYGTAFADKKELEEFLQMREEAKKRDHRKLGKELDLFTFSPLVGSGLPLFTPRGTVIRRELENFVQSLQEPLGYQRVWIPHIAKSDLYKTSGHWDKFENDLFHVRGKGETKFVMKPMNCPHHSQLYASRPRSYRDLPLRFSEVTTCYRDEQPGELLGLSRVRGFTQDDAHVFCRPDQIEEEVKRVYQIIDRFYEVFDFEMSVRLSLRDPGVPEKYLGTDEVWEESQATLRKILTDRNVDFYQAEGEAAFYGPKIDFMLRDSLKRKWQLATVQLDFNMPNRFNLTYIDQDGSEKTPVKIHRAILGSIERFMSILLEHYAGALPLWLSPTQVSVLPISDEQAEHGRHIMNDLREVGIRAEIDDRGESIGKKIRDAQMMRVPVMLVVGKKEVESGTVAVRTRWGQDEGAKTLEEVREDLLEKTETKSN